MSDESWSIRNDQDAEWAIKRIKEAQADTEKWAAWYKAKAEEVKQRNEGTIYYMQAKLQDYFDQQPHHTTKSGIHKYGLPSAELIWKPAGVEFKRDEEALLEWCKANRPDAIKTTMKVDWAMLKKEINQTGVLPDGVTPEESAPRFSVNIKEEENV